MDWNKQSREYQRKEVEPIPPEHDNELPLGENTTVTEKTNALKTVTPEYKYSSEISDKERVRRLVTQFGKEQQDMDLINKHIDIRIGKLRETNEGRTFLDEVKAQGLTIDDLIQGKRFDSYLGIDYVTWSANIAKDAGLKPGEIGRTVHSVAELRDLYQYPDDVHARNRSVEQKYKYEMPNGASSHVELDRVIVRGDQHYLQDYKPINMAKYMATDEGRIWSENAKERFGDGWLDRLKSGECPLGQQWGHEHHESLLRFIKHETKQYITQLDLYRNVYIDARRHEARYVDLDPERVHVSVRPYYVY